MPTGSTRPPSRKRRKLSRIAKSEKMAGKKNWNTEMQVTRQRRIEDAERKGQGGSDRTRMRKTQQSIDTMQRKRSKRPARTTDEGPVYDRSTGRYSLSGKGPVTKQKHGKRPKRKR